MYFVSTNNSDLVITIYFRFTLVGFSGNCNTESGERRSLYTPVLDKCRRHREFDTRRY